MMRLTNSHYRRTSLVGRKINFIDPGLSLCSVNHARLEDTSSPEAQHSASTTPVTSDIRYQKIIVRVDPNSG